MIQFEFIQLGIIQATDESIFTRGEKKPVIFFRETNDPSTRARAPLERVTASHPSTLWWGLGFYALRFMGRKIDPKNYSPKKNARSQLDIRAANHQNHQGVI